VEPRLNIGGGTCRS